MLNGGQVEIDPCQNGLAIHAPIYSPCGGDLVIEETMSAILADASLEGAFIGGILYTCMYWVEIYFGVKVLGYCFDGMERLVKWLYHRYKNRH